MRKPKFLYDVYAGRSRLLGCGPIACDECIGQVFALNIRSAYDKAHKLVQRVENQTGQRFIALMIH